ncbi:hypothetical protein Tsubulata_006703 [Turnera subulata]|uniref:Uncharacterized protein n=1 Tax=Turnera subulata TaxID=218843 RepID=A0A9Q0JRH5_9ROSI|nr:hypothetical protein Tsubulata_006703 [Turnera subulata]
MGDSEKLTALKMAYAEIILNTAKEAAARIMVSENKAHRYQCELLAAKDEALRMLIRLKQMLDSKVKEAEVTHVNQQKKIEELEAQLGEAEDIVKDLRTELRELQDELERVSSNQFQTLGGPNPEVDAATQVLAFEERSTPASLVSSLPASQCGSFVGFETNGSILNGISSSGKCCSDQVLKEANNFACIPVFSSIVMSSKEPELYRNGCTQRIRAFERNMLDDNLSFSGQCDDGKNQRLIREDEEGKTIHRRPTATDNVCSAEKNLCEIKAVHENGKRIQFHRVRPFGRKRKRGIGYKKLRTPSFNDFSKQAGEDPKTIEIKDQEDLKTSVTVKSVSNASGEVVMSGTVEFSKSHSEFGGLSPVLNRANSDNTMADDLELIGQAARSLEDSEFSAIKTNTELTDASIANSDQKACTSSELLSTVSTDNKFLKFTFQRKRRKGFPSSPDGKSTVDDINLKRMRVEIENGSLESHDPSLITESKDNRRPAQVACQLISLSEKKWR